MGTFFAFQQIVTNAQVMAIVGTIFGAVVVFGLLYLVLERYKRLLAALIFVASFACAGAYWYIAHKSVSPLDIPKTVVTERIKAAPVSLPRPRPRVKRGCYPPIHRQVLRAIQPHQN